MHLPTTTLDLQRKLVFRVNSEKSKDLQIREIYVTPEVQEGKPVVNRPLIRPAISWGQTWHFLAWYGYIYIYIC